MNYAIIYNFSFAALYTPTTEETKPATLKLAIAKQAFRIFSPYQTPYEKTKSLY